MTGIKDKDSPLSPLDKEIFGLSGSTFLSTTIDLSLQLSASSMFVYQLMGVVTEPPFGQFPNTPSKLDSPLNQQYYFSKTTSYSAA